MCCYVVFVYILLCLCTLHFLTILLLFLSQIHSCRDSLRLPPRPVLEQAERKLIEWGKGDEALEKVAEMLGRAHPNAAVVPQEEIPPPPNGPPPHHAKDLIARVSPSTPVGTTAGAPTHHKKERLDLIEVRDKVNGRG